MRRILENLAQERKEKEEEFRDRLERIRNEIEEDSGNEAFLRLRHLLSRLKDITRTEEKARRGGRRRFLPFFSRSPAGKTSGNEIQQVTLILSEMENLLSRNDEKTRALSSRLLDLLELSASLADARDREWDALGSNHLGMIFKSMEWRVDKLAAAYGDATILMKKFLLLREKLNGLAGLLEEKKTLPASLVKEILEPLEDWRYAGFENRFRGYEEKIKKHLADYISHFSKGGKVLDLGCGRGEFLELLRENGIEGAGIDLNSQMVETCLDKGLACEKGDILEKLAGMEDGSLSGIFSSQVIEHLPPAHLKRMIELSYLKLTPGGTIVLETVNPTSVFALVQVYYLDLSHQNPVHPLALRFLLESIGFEDVEVKFSSPPEEEMLQNLQGADETSSVLNRNIDSLNRLLFGPADYAAVARKK